MRFYCHRLIVFGIVGLLTAPAWGKSTPASTAVKVAAAQLLTDVGNLDRNKNRILESIREAKDQGCQIVLFHEGCLTGYPNAKQVSDMNFSEVRTAEREIRALAEELGIAVLLGSTGKVDGHYFNYVLVIDESGRVLGQYNKTWRAGEPHYRAGTGPVIFRIAGVEATVIICHDLRYPELTRLAVTAGAKIVFIANNESGITAEHKQLGYRSMQISRATENLVYSVMSNCPADPNNIKRPNCSHGNSKIVDPMGNVIDEAGVFEERLVMADLNLKKATASTPLRTIGQNPGTARLYQVDYENKAYAQWVQSGLKLVRRLDGTEVPNHFRQVAQNDDTRSGSTQTVGNALRSVPAKIPETVSKHLRATTPVSFRNDTGVESKAGSLTVEESETAITLKQDGQSVVTYNKVSPPAPEGIDKVYERSGCLHPIQSPKGRVATQMFPVDHAHQHGVFTAWVRTIYDGQPVDFWNLAGRTGRVLHERVVSTFQAKDKVGFEVDLLHRKVTEPAVDVLRERWKITAYPTEGTHHCFDLESVQTAITDKPLVINKYHYGGFALRGPTRWLTDKDSYARKALDLKREPSDFTNHLGSNRAKANHEHAKWVSLTGAIKGKPVSIAVLCHPENFRAPQAARIHPTKPYFCFAPCVDDAFTIDRDHPYKARYRFLVTDAKPDPKWLDRQWNIWCRRGGKD